MNGEQVSVVQQATAQATVPKQLSVSGYTYHG